MPVNYKVPVKFLPLRFEYILHLKTLGEMINWVKKEWTMIEVVRFVYELSERHFHEILVR